MEINILNIYHKILFLRSIDHIYFISVIPMHVISSAFQNIFSYYFNLNIHVYVLCLIMKGHILSKKLRCFGDKLIFQLFSHDGYVMFRSFCLYCRNNMFRFISFLVMVTLTFAKNLQFACISSWNYFYKTKLLFLRICQVYFYSY